MSAQSPSAFPSHPGDPREALAPFATQHSTGSSGALAATSTAAFGNAYTARSHGARLSDPVRVRLSEAAQQQEPDYSLRGLFQQAHGDYMLRRERYNPMLELELSALPDARVKSEAGHFDMYRFSGDLDAPVTISTDAYLRLGAFFESRRYNTSSGMVGFGDDTLYSAGLNLGFGWFVDEDILVEALVQPGTWSDWEGTLTSDDWQFWSSVLVTVRTTEELFLKGGVRYNEYYRDAPVLPWLGLSWQVDNFRVDVLLPDYLEVSWWPSADFSVLGGLEIQGAEYRTRSGNNVGTTNVQEVLVYGGALWRLNDFLSFNARAGMTVAGDYRLDDGNPVTPIVDGALEPGLFVQVGMGVDF